MMGWWHCLVERQGTRSTGITNLVGVVVVLER